MVIDPANFAGVAVDYPYANTPMNLILCERPHIRCYGIVDSGEWETNFHDSLMGDHRRVPEYSHLQIRNSDLAKHFPFSSLRADAPVKTLQDKIREVAASLWPDGNRPVRIKERNLAIQAEFRIPPNERTIRRALNEKH